MQCYIHKKKSKAKEMFVFIQVNDDLGAMAQRVKSLPTIQETQVQSLGWEDPLEKEIATHSSILAWKIPWIEEPGGLQSIGCQRVRHDEQLHIQVNKMPYISLILNHFKGE